MMITTPFPDLAAWTQALRALEIPIFRDSARAIAEMMVDDDRASGVAIGRLAESDPLLTLRILALAARHRSSRAETDTETAVTGVVMMGLSRFFADFEHPMIVEELLADDPTALVGLQEVVNRANRAACFALGFAVHRTDTDAEVIQEAAMLHDFTEMLLWCRAPQLARQMQQRQRADSTLRSTQVQLDVLTGELHELQRALRLAWGLPELLTQITDHSQMKLTRVRNVVLAVDLARHTQHGWDNAAIPDDLRAIGEMLNMTPESVHRKVLELDS